MLWNHETESDCVNGSSLRLTCNVKRTPGMLLNITPMSASLAPSYGGRITVGDLNILKERHLICQYKIRHMPTLLFFDALGTETGRTMGNTSAVGILTR